MDMLNQIEPDIFIGKGVYGLREAASIVDMPVPQVKRWVKGYRVAQKEYTPVVASDFPMMDGKVAISFDDLIELHFIKAFLKHGVSLQSIRKAAALAAEIIGVEKHPFARHEFKTDCKSIMHSVESRMLNLNENQYELEGIINRSLFKGFEYCQKQACAWHPDGNSVVINPLYALGKPIITGTGIRTRAVYHAYIAEEKNEKIIAALYGITPQQVRDAVMFEQRMEH